MTKALILGARSFVATGFSDKLINSGYIVHQFSRGKNKRVGDIVYGDYLTISSNNLFDNCYDIVVNFAVMKNMSLKENIQYVHSLVEFCKSHSVKKLIHFSSTMVYDHQLQEVTEESPIENVEYTCKKGYGELKIGVDQYLLRIKDSLPFELILVRPGYVLADGVQCPFVKRFPLGIFLIKGNKNSTLPIVKREDIHEALIAISRKERNLLVYHFFPNDGMTKYQYAKKNMGGMILYMPQWLFKGIPCLLTKIGVIPKSLYSRFEGMYTKSKYSSEKTENYLGIKFK